MAVGEIVLVDTGPLVALFDPSDRDHAACTAALAALYTSRLLTTLAVVTEVTYLLAFSTDAQQALLTFVSAGGVELADVAPADVSRAGALMKKYADLPMDFADATLVVVGESLKTPWIFTLDRRDFSVYRVGRKAFRILPG